MTDGNDMLLKAQSGFKSQVDKVFQVSVLYLRIYFPDIVLLHLLTICTLYSSHFQNRHASLVLMHLKGSYSI